MFLRQSTAVTVPIGPFIDDSDARTFEAALVIQKADVKLSRNGGSYSPTSADQGGGDAGAAYLGNGDYAVTLNTEDTNNLGRLRVSIAKGGALPVWSDFVVLPPATYDRLLASGQMADEVHLAKAALANARTHVIETGVNTIKDDDGETTLRTLTPAENGGVVTITPG